MMSFVFLYLARHPEPRATLRARPDLIVNAADELIRRHGLVASTGVLTRDVEMHGAAMKGRRAHHPAQQLRRTGHDTLPRPLDG